MSINQNYTVPLLLNKILENLWLSILSKIIQSTSSPVTPKMSFMGHNRLNAGNFAPPGRFRNLPETPSIKLRINFLKPEGSQISPEEGWDYSWTRPLWRAFDIYLEPVSSVTLWEHWTGPEDLGVFISETLSSNAVDVEARFRQQI